VTNYPAERGEILAFTPDSIANLPSPPVFRIKPGTGRDRRALTKLLISEGLVRHSLADLREETLRGLKAQWSDDVFGEQEGRIRGYWDAFDQHIKEHEGEEEIPDFVHADAQAMHDLSKQIFEAWEPLRQMAADNQDYDATWPSLILCVMLAGWSGIDVMCKREAGIVPLESIAELSESLSSIEEENGGIVDGIVSPGVAFMQLCSEAANRLTLNRSEEKNSASPSPSTSTPNTSKKGGKANKSSRSKASASSTETPAT